MNRTLLPDRGVLAVRGEDAQDFLQGLVTNDVRKAEGGKAVFSAVLSPQGRFLYDFFIIRQPDGFWLETDKARLTDLKKRLSIYRLRAKVELQELSETSVAAFWGEAEPTGEHIYADPRLPELGWRAIGADAPLAPEAYERHRLTLGVPEASRDLVFDRSILLEYGYDELHGVDFHKGCYVGQEVTARSKHRANLRRFIHQVTADAPLPPAGTPVMAGDKSVGEIRSSLDNQGLAHLHAQDSAKAERLECGGVTLHARLPEWCRAVFTEDAK